jgi:hypothetical protein
MPCVRSFTILATCRSGCHRRTARAMMTPRFMSNRRQNEFSVSSGGSQSAHGQEHPAPRGTQDRAFALCRSLRCRKPPFSTGTGPCWDSVDLHALAWHEAMVEFGHDVSFEQARSQIGKGGDKLIPESLSAEEQKDHGKQLEEWRAATASRASTCRWCASSRRCPICCGASAMRACASPWVLRPRRTRQVSRDRPHRRPG